MKKEHRLRQVLAALLLSTVVFLSLGGGTASAHAKVISATPGIGSTVAQTPTSVTVETAENLNPNPKLSNLFVYGPGGELISQGNAAIPLSKPTEMSVPIKVDGTGIYIVRWITSSAADNDPDEGAFVFTVKAGAASTPAPVTGQATPPPTTPETGSVPLWVPVAVGVLALLLGLGLGTLGTPLRRRTAVSGRRALRKALVEQRREKP